MLEGILTIVAAIGFFILFCFAFNSLSLIVEWVGSIIVWLIVVAFRALVAIFVISVVAGLIVYVISFVFPGIWDFVLSLI